MTGWNLPPGCEVHDIPGNRPEDMLAEAIAGGWRPHCARCGAFLRVEGDSGSREVEGYDVEYERRPCRRCGHENESILGAWPAEGAEVYEPEPDYEAIVEARAETRFDEESWDRHHERMAEGT